MKKLSISERNAIVDLITEKDLGISEFALEKDFMVTDALRALSQISDTPFYFVFCGGTCLSKAYGILDRVSEDVDIKVVLKPSAVKMSRAAVRKSLSNLKERIVGELVVGGFSRDDTSAKAYNGNSCIVLDIGYETHFEQPEAMRATLKLELNCTGLSLPAHPRTISLLFLKLYDNSSVAGFSMPCVDLVEATVEKLVAFPRRLAMHLSGSGRALDQTLVRHLYDVFEILAKHPSLLDDGSVVNKLMMGALREDAGKFASQHPQFSSAPISEINAAMQYARTDPGVRRMYDRFIKVMVYAANPPDFESALAEFDRVLTVALPTIDTQSPPWRNH